MAETVPALLRAAAERWGGKAALKSMSEPATSFKTLDIYADRFAGSLIADGMRPGERIGIWAPNMWEWVAAAVGGQRAGGTIVPLNVRLRVAEITDIMLRARVRWLVSVGQHRGVDHPALLRGHTFPDLRRLIVLRPAGRLSKNESAWNSWLELADRVHHGQVRHREAGVTGDTVADILFTSGTTGRPKGAVFTHRSTVLSGRNMVNFARVTETDCLCPLGPFSHFAGYKGGWVNGLVTGATVCWNDAHDSDSILQAIEKMKITVMPAPPVVWQEVLDNPHHRERDISSLRFIATGSSMIPPRLVTRLISELNVEQVGTGYGLTESGGMTNFSRRDDPVESIAHTAGRPAPDAEICIADPDGTRLGPNETGEILVRTERAMREYLDDPEATAAALDADGWLHTGDVGKIDENGYLTVTDRLKDMFITNGYNVYPAEVEKLITACPEVAQCAVIGVPHPRKGEIGHAFVVRVRGTDFGEDDLMAWCRKNMTTYKIPAAVSFVEDLPRNAQGKVLKQQLKKQVTGVGTACQA